jgi:hypothetical protein
MMTWSYLRETNKSRAVIWLIEVFEIIQRWQTYKQTCHASLRRKGAGDESWVRGELHMKFTTLRVSRQARPCFVDRAT